MDVAVAERRLKRCIPAVETRT